MSKFQALVFIIKGRQFVTLNKRTVYGSNMPKQFFRQKKLIKNKPIPKAIFQGEEAYYDHQSNILAGKH